MLLTLDFPMQFPGCCSFGKRKTENKTSHHFYYFFFFCSQFLEEAGLYESEEENTKRKAVLLEIERVTSCFHFF
jgi:hypothetical protein